MDRENSEVEMEMQRKERLNEKESREARKTARRKSVEVWATDCERAVEPINRADFMSGFDDGWLSRGKADRLLWEKHKEQERQALIAALAERDRLDPDAPNAIAFKHDPYCDCGICQYCRGDEDKFGNPTRSKEVESIREKVLITASIECSECDDAKTENLQGGNLRTLRPEFAMIVWKYGWVVELDKVLCPNCRADAEEWRSI